MKPYIKPEMAIIDVELESSILTSSGSNENVYLYMDEDSDYFN